MRKLILIISLLISFLSLRADYSVTEVKGKASGMRGKQKISLAYGTSLLLSDKITIPNGASVSFKNSSDGVVYTTKINGTHTVKELIAGASDDARQALTAIKKYLNVMPKKKTLKDKNYSSSGVVNRSGILRREEIQLSERLEGSCQVAAAIAGFGKGVNSVEPFIPLSIVRGKANNYLLPVIVKNIGDTPLYVNAIKIKENGEVDFSPMGIRTGIYSLLPGEEVEMECPEWLESTEYILASEVPFDIYEVIRLLSLHESLSASDKNVYIISLSTDN